tara:strand:- start:308 stop:712 length:405 start_codon:yes stop_codon:yes gene_type:complete
MANPKWGIKRTCNNCATKFYDLLKEKIVCPVCGTVYNSEVKNKIKSINKEIKISKGENQSIETTGEEKKLSSIIEGDEIETENENGDNLNLDEEIINDEVNSIGSDEMDDILIDVDDNELEIDIKAEDEDSVEK